MFYSNYPIAILSTRGSPWHHYDSPGFPQTMPQFGCRTQVALHCKDLVLIHWPCYLRTGKRVHRCLLSTTLEISTNLKFYTKLCKSWKISWIHIYSQTVFPFNLETIYINMPWFWLLLIEHPVYIWILFCCGHLHYCPWLCKGEQDTGPPLKIVRALWALGEYREAVVTECVTGSCNSRELF